MEDVPLPENWLYSHAEDTASEYRGCITLLALQSILSVAQAHS